MHPRRRRFRQLRMRKKPRRPFSWLFQRGPIAVVGCVLDVKEKTHKAPLVAKGESDNKEG